MTFASVAKKAVFQMLNVVEKPTKNKQMRVTNYLLLLLIKTA